MFIIYLITNQNNGKVYVGKTSKTIEERWEQHVKDSVRMKSYIYRAIRKHGPENFIIQNISYVETEQAANDLEKLCIKIFSSYKPERGYNTTMGGDGVIPTEETRLKMSVGIKRAWKTNPEYRAKQEARIIPQEVKDKLRACRLGKPLSEKTKVAMAKARLKNDPRLGKRHSLETIEKLREARIKYFSVPGNRKKAGESHKGKHTLHGIAHYNTNKNIPDEIAEQMYLEGKILQEIADVFGVSLTAIRNHLLWRGIKMRKSGKKNKIIPKELLAEKQSESNGTCCPVPSPQETFLS